ncbi:MAG TPA: hypothetical protein P5293_01100 [Bacteroidales bacterium]|nr:hypothetical protein [Bacteroidales bacterium]
MKEKEFMELPIGPKDYVVGECFLEGKSIVVQRDTKKVGDLITYFKIIEIKGDKRIEYVPVIERLEE